MNTRQKRIIDVLTKHGEVMVQDLATQMGVTTMTIRRDLDALEHDGQLIRTPGGAVLSNAGIIEIETQPSDMKLEPVSCPRCKTMNSHDSTYCSQCSLVLTEKAALSIEESVEVARGSDDYQLLLQRLKADLSMRS